MAERDKKGYLIKNEREPHSKALYPQRFIYLRDLGPVVLEISEGGEIIMTDCGDPILEKVVELGEFAELRNLGEVEIPQEILDYVEAERALGSAESLARPKLKEILGVGA